MALREELIEIRHLLRYWRSRESTAHLLLTGRSIRCRLLIDRSGVWTVAGVWSGLDQCGPLSFDILVFIRTRYTNQLTTRENLPTWKFECLCADKIGALECIDLYELRM